MKSGICFKIIQKKRGSLGKKEGKGKIKQVLQTLNNCWIWVGLCLIIGIFSLFVKVCLEINIRKFYDNKRKEIMPDQRQSYLSSNIKTSFQLRVFFQGQKLSNKWSTKSKNEKVMFSGAQVLKTSFCGMCIGRSRQRSLRKENRNQKWHIVLFVAW